MKIIKEKTIKYRLVTPETKDEKEELEMLIKKSKSDIDINPEDFVFVQIEDD